MDSSLDFQPAAPRAPARSKTVAASVEPVLSEYELGRRAEIERNTKFLASVEVLVPPKEALEDESWTTSTRNGT